MRQSWVIGLTVGCIAAVAGAGDWRISLAAARRHAGAGLRPCPSPSRRGARQAPLGLTPGSDPMPTATTDSTATTDPPPRPTPPRPPERRHRDGSGGGTPPTGPRSWRPGTPAGAPISPPTWHSTGHLPYLGAVTPPGRSGSRRSLEASGLTGRGGASFPSATKLGAGAVGERTSDPGRQRHGGRAGQCQGQGPVVVRAASGARRGGARRLCPRGHRDHGVRRPTTTTTPRLR